MKIKINLSNERGFQWYQAERGQCKYSAKGNAFFNNVFFEQQKFADLVAKKFVLDQPEIFLRNLNGNFLIVAEKREHVVVAVDRVRSFPMFFSETNALDKQSIHLSDDAYWIRKELGHSDPNSFNKTLLMTSLYTLGNNTVFDDIRQLKAGELIKVNISNGKINKSIKRYYELWHDQYEDIDYEVLCSEYDGVLNHVFERIIKSTGGRPLIVPLSGGLDSRLIVTMLKKMNADNVVCYTYGGKNSYETEISQLVSATLNFPNHRVEYNSKQQYRDFHNPERKKTSKYAFNLCAHMNHHDIFALWELKKNKLLPKDGIIIPGYFAGFITGVTFPQKFSEKKINNKDIIINFIINRHFGEWSFRKKNSSFYETLSEKLSEALIDKEISDFQSAFTAYKWWEWQERQAKYIINACRVYEYLGFEWRLPFCDNEILEFWKNVPVKYQIGSYFYRRYLNESLYKNYDLIKYNQIRRKKGWGNSFIHFLRSPTKNRSNLQEKLAVWRFYQEILPGNLLSLLYMIRPFTYLAFTLFNELDEYLDMC